MSVSIHLSIHDWIHPFTHQSSLIETHSSTSISFPHPFHHPLSPLVGASGSGSPLICSQNKQPGKHHETFRGGSAAFSLIHTGILEMHKNSCSQSSPLQRGFTSCVHVCCICPNICGNLDVCTRIAHVCVCIRVSDMYVCIQESAFHATGM